MLRFCAAGLGLALLLITAGDGAAQVPRPQPVQSAPEAQSPPQPPAPPPAEFPAAQPPGTEPAPPAAEAPPAPAQTAPAAAAPTAAPLFDPRAAQQGPIPITVVPSPKSEEELVAERQDREQRASLEFNLMLVAWLLAGVGFLQFLAVAAQGLYLIAAVNAVRRPLEVIERNQTLAQRAFVYVASLDWGVVGGNLRVTPSLENGGTTPSRSLRVSTNWRAWHGELPADFVYNYSQAPHRLFLGARSRVQIGSVLIPMRDVQAAIEGRLQLYLWGRATYEDMFEGSEPHFVEFCFRIEPSGTAPEAVAVTFMPYGPHNRSEQDSQRVAERGRQ